MLYELAKAISFVSMCKKCFIQQLLDPESNFLNVSEYPDIGLVDWTCDGHTFTVELASSADILNSQYFVNNECV